MNNKRSVKPKVVKQFGKMPKASWNSDAQLTTAWLDYTNPKKRPFGDLYRMAIINPLVFSKMFVSNESKIGTLSTIKEILRGISDEYNDNDILPELEKWHRKQIGVRQNQPKRVVLDLGAGEGWLGRWLAQIGVEYCGVDFCSEFVSKGNERWRNLKSKGKFSLLEYDLVTDFSNIFKYLKQKSINPNFILFNCVIEYIKDPLPFLSALAEYLSQQEPDCNVILITVNPDFQRFRGLGKGIDRVVESPEQWTMESIGKSVDAWARAWSEYPRLFRDAHFRLNESLMLYMPPRFTGAFEEDYAPREHAREVAPFIYYSFSVITRSIVPVTDDLLEKALGETAIKFLDERQKNNLKENKSAIKQYKFAVDQLMFNRSDAAGHLWIVIEGSARLLKSSDSSELGVFFRKGDTIGELELPMTEEEPPISFKYRCKAGTEGCSVLDIPANLAIPLLMHRSFTSHLLNQLRTKLRAKVWLDDVMAEEKRYACLHSELLQGLGSYVHKVAATILWACQIQHCEGDKPFQDGSVCYMTDTELGRKAVPLGEKEEAIKACKFLTLIGVIDAFPGKCSEISKTELFEMRKNILAECFTCGDRNLKIDRMDSIVRKLTNCADSNEFLKRINEDIERMRSYSTPMTSDKNCLHRAFEYLKEKHSSITSLLDAQTPAFYIVKDRWLLEALACSDATILNLLDPFETFKIAEKRVIEKATNKHGSVNKSRMRWQNVVDNASKGRQLRYFHTYWEFYFRGWQNQIKT